MAHPQCAVDQPFTASAQASRAATPPTGCIRTARRAGTNALVKATADWFTEVARFKALEGKTWNHPVLIRDVLVVRNGEEMAAYRLTLENR